MSTNTTSEVQTTQREPERKRRIFAFKATQVVWLLLGILEAMFALRFILKLVGANPGQPDRRFYLRSHRFVPSALFRIDLDTAIRRHDAGILNNNRHGGVCIDCLGN